MVTIITRAAKGSALTYAEMDANFTNLKAAVEALQGGGITYSTLFADDFSTETTGDLGGQNGWIDGSGANPKPQRTAGGKLDMRSTVGPSLVYRNGTTTLPRLSAVLNMAGDTGIAMGWGYAPGSAHFRVEFGATGPQNGISAKVVFVPASGGETNVFGTPTGLISALTDTNVRVTAKATSVVIELAGQTFTYSEPDPARQAVLQQAGGFVIRNGQGGTGQRLLDNYLIEVAA